MEVTNTPWTERIQFIAPSSSLSSIEIGSSTARRSHNRSNGHVESSAVAEKIETQQVQAASPDADLVPKCLHVSPFMDMV